jgi:hypothetical protein
MTTVKITELSDIGANLASSTVVPVVNMAGTPITQKTNVGNIANLILEGAGVDYSEASVALLAQTVSNAAQPNITSVGTLTNVVVSGNATVNGNITSNGTVYVGNLSTTGVASITTLDVGTTANLGSIANVIITGGTIGQILSTDGEGNLSWTSDATTYGDSNVVTLLSAFGSNTISTTGIITADGANLSNVPYANLTGAPSLGNISNINLDGNVSNLLTGNGTYVAIPVVPTVGNIATLNLDGSNSNVLYGNGVFAAVAGGANTGNITFDQSTIESNQSNAYINLNASGSGILSLGTNDQANVRIVTDEGNVNNQWTFDTTGNLILAGGNSVIQSIANSSLDPTLPNVSTMVLTPDANYNSQVLVLDPTAPGHIHLRAYAFSNIDEPAANIFLGGEDTAFEVTSGPNNEVRIHSGGNTWTFGNDGRLTFPGTPRIDTDANNFEVQAAEAINFEANTVVNIYTDTGNTTYQWQFGDDGNLTLPDTTGVLANVSITLEANDTGNITGLSLIGDSNANLYAHGNVTIVSDSSNTTATWSFVNTGDIVLPNDVVIGDDGSNGMMLSVPTVTPGTYSDWTFDQSGNLTLPTGGQIIVSGGLVSSGASPAPTINGFSITNSVDISGNGNIAGNNISATGNVTAINLINTVTVYANLPAATTAGIRAFISDANLAPIGNFGVEVSGGGGNYVPVFSDGANWCIG